MHFISPIIHFTPASDYGRNGHSFSIMKISVSVCCSREEAGERLKWTRIADIPLPLPLYFAYEHITDDRAGTVQLMANYPINADSIDR